VTNPWYRLQRLQRQSTCSVKRQYL